MKKQLAFILVLALLLPVLAGCQSAYAAKHTPETKATKTAAAPAITRDEAVQIALKDANLTPEEIFDLEAELDKERGVLHYDVDFEKAAADYDYDIDAVTGQILRVEKPQPAKEKPAAATSANTTEKKQLSKTEARDIALKHAGLKASEVRQLETELDRDDGKVHYDVDFEKDGYDYDYEIDAYSGKILKAHKERD